MTFFCDGCKEMRDFWGNYGIMVITPDGRASRYCKSCHRPKGATPDVFWDGKPEGNLADDPVTGKPRVFFSKGEKAAYLRERGLMEAGDRVHGAPVMTSQISSPKVDSKHEVKMALKKVKEMGRDVRRQAYLRLIKEGYKRA